MRCSLDRGPSRCGLHDVDSIRCDQRNMDKKKIAEQLKKLNEDEGPVTDELRNYVAAQTKAHKAILKSLKDGPKSVPELAAECELPTDKVLWYVTGLRKYGKVREIPGRTTYPKYAIMNAEAE